LRLNSPYLNRIATAVSERDVYDAFVIFAEQMLTDPQLQARPGQRRCTKSFGSKPTAEAMRFHGV
jgi:hypothetical protein